MTPVPRKPTWQRDMLAAMTSWDGKPFVWGDADCGCAMAAVVEAMTGVDPISEWRGHYGTDRRATFRYFRTLGFSGWGDAVHHAFKRHGWTKIDPRAARVGDVGITHDYAFAIRMPRGFVARTEDGRWTVAPRVPTAWGIG